MNNDVNNMSILPSMKIINKHYTDGNKSIQTNIFAVLKQLSRLKVVKKLIN